MYLKNLQIKNFRAIKELNLEFNKGLNILIGENNAGKSAIIDALRICLSYGKQVRDIYVRKSDFYIDRSNPDFILPDIEFHLFFKVEKNEETGWFNDLHAVNTSGQSELQLHFRYYIANRKGIEKIKYKVWGGEKEGQQIEPDVLDLLYSVYLGALRDAEQNLRPIKGNRIGQLYVNLNEDRNKSRIDDDKQKELASKVIDALHHNKEWTELIATGKEKVNEHLKQSSFHGKGEVEIDFLPYEFRGIVDNLRMQIPVFSQDDLQNDPSKQVYFDIYQNGLGYNNLIYTATVLGDLKNRKHFDPETYIALLIEEPEAHLHPQLQNVFFKYINDLDKIGFQLFVTSHSPTITAKADLNSLIVLQNQENDISALSIRNSNLDDDNKTFLSKFLDVTKSQLFFANGVIFVEGISEALLLPVFAKMMDMDGKYDLDKNGIEIVNVNGVAFEHFGKLFNSMDRRKRLNARAAIITDSDPNIITGEKSDRAAKAKALESGLLKVQFAENTFEHDLFLADIANRGMLLDIYGMMHPRTVIEKGNSELQYAYEFMKKLCNNKDKSELAHRLAVMLESEVNALRLTSKEHSENGHSIEKDSESLAINFKVPDYVKQAIKWVVKDDADV